MAGEGEARPLRGGKIWKVWCGRAVGSSLTEELGLRSPGGFGGRGLVGDIYLRPSSLAAGHWTAWVLDFDLGK